MFRMQDAQQFRFLNYKKSGWRNGASRAHADGLPGHASLAKKVGRAKHRNHGFLAGAIHHGQFHAALLDVHDGGSGFSLRVNGFAPAVVHYFSCHAGSVEKSLSIKLPDFSVILVFLWFHSGDGYASQSGHSSSMFSLSGK